MIASIEKYLFYLFIFALPFQTRIILKSWGVGFNEWSSAFLYGTDLLLILLFILWIIRKGFPRSNLVDTRSDLVSYKIGSCTQFLFFIFLVIAALSITQAGNKILSFYSWLKILELAGLYFYVRSSLGKVFTLNGAFLAVIISGFFQSLIAIGQSLLQHSLGLKWLGESILRNNFSGVAVVATEGEKFLRAYGATPHPNILAAWLFLAIFAFYFLFLYRAQKSGDTTIQGRSGYSFGELADPKLCTPKAPRNIFALMIYSVLLWGLFSTFSRVAIGLWIAGIVVRLLIIWLKKKKYNLGLAFKNRLRLLLGITPVVVIVFGFFYWPQVQSRIFISSQEQAVSQRILYNKLASQMIADKPLLGIGLGQFVRVTQVKFKNYPDFFYQPVHNMYLLIANEIGLLGVAAFLGWLAALIWAYIRNNKFKEFYHISFFIVFLSILAMGLFDHFLWTLQQGQLIFWLTVGLISASGKTLEVV